MTATSSARSFPDEDVVSSIVGELPVARPFLSFRQKSETGLTQLTDKMLAADFELDLAFSGQCDIFHYQLADDRWHVGPDFKGAFECRIVKLRHGHIILIRKRLFEIWNDILALSTYAYFGSKIIAFMNSAYIVLFDRICGATFLALSASLALWNL